MSDENGARDVCLLGWGAATSIGETSLASAAAVRAGVAGFADHPTMIDMNGDNYVIAAAPYLKMSLSLEERVQRLTSAAAQEALQVLVDGGLRDARFPAYLGLPEPRPGWSTGIGKAAAVVVDAACQRIGKAKELRSLPEGHAAGALAIGQAFKQIQQGSVDLCLAGGVDSYITDETLAWIEDSDQLHNGTNAYGFVPGEAACFCLLGSRRFAEEKDFRVLAKVAGVTVAVEPNCIKTDTISTAAGLTQAFREMFASLPEKARQIHEIICDQNGETYRANEYGFTMQRTNRYFVDAGDFQAPADCWGDVGAASGPLFLGLAATAAAKGYAKGPRTLIFTSSEGGQRGVIVAKAAVKPGGSR